MAITDKVKNWISKDILDGVYPAGSKMPTRMELMEKYQIARASADKVIRQLVKEGILRSSQGSGTYVVDLKLNAPHIYVVLNTDIECAEANSFHTKLASMLSDLPPNLKHSLIGSKDFEKHFSAILQNPSSRVIWSRPSIKAYNFIASLDRANIPQMLINRPLQSFNFVTTNTRQALYDTFSIIKTQFDSPRLGLIAPPLNLDEPFLAEREVYFHQMVYEFGGSMNFMARSQGKSAIDIMEVTRLALDKIDQLDYLFVPDFSMMPFVIALITERKIELGKDLQLISIDWQELDEGLICIKQDWDSMFKQAIDWISCPQLEKVQLFIPPEIIE
jgi:DNA-binding transcriptional regulator YhcF (GntR family)